jgi:uncharacterized protein (TIGR03000 family)
MKNRRCTWALCVAAVVLGSFAGSTADAGGRRAFVAPSVAYYNPPPIGGYGVYYWMYVAPLPGYGILPPPFSMMNQYGYAYDPYGLGYQRSAEGYGYTPRMRVSLYPAIPFEKAAQERLTELRRVRYEITVPCANAVVLFDGVKTKQTGMTRVFVTPPMQEDKEYTSNITVEWTDKDGTPRTRTRTFAFRGGDTVRHTFE